MTIKTRLIGMVASATALTGNAMAATNSTGTYAPSVSNGFALLSQLPFIGQLYGVVNMLIAATIVLGIATLAIIGIRAYFMGWDAVEVEIRAKKKMVDIVLLLATLILGIGALMYIPGWFGIA